MAPIRLRLHTPTKPRRAFAALVALCYLFLSAVVSFQHTDCLLSETACAPAPTSTAMRASRVDWTELHSHAAHCLACEWQAVNVSAAIPLFVFVCPAPLAPDASLAPASHRRLAEFSYPARAPPLQV